MSSWPIYNKGEWDAICDACGQKFKSSQLHKRWDGLMVCDKDWEQRQPQDLVRAKVDIQAPPWTRPEPGDSFAGLTGSTINATTTLGSSDTTVNVVVTPGAPPVVITLPPTPGTGQVIVINNINSPSVTLLGGIVTPLDIPLGSSATVSWNGFNWSITTPSSNVFGFIPSWHDVTITGGSGSYPTSLVYGNGIFVGVNNDSNQTTPQVYTSINGTVWTQTLLVPAIQPDGWGGEFQRSPKQVVYGNGAFVAIGFSGYAIRSLAGIVWAQITLPAIVGGVYAGTWSGITFTNSLFVIYGYDNTFGFGWVTSTSIDGITWTTPVAAPALSNPSNSFLTGKNGNFFFTNIAPVNPMSIWVSSDGVNWTQHTAGSELGRQYSLEFVSGKYITSNKLSAIGFYTSTDTISWAKTTGRQLGLLSTSGVGLLSMDNLNYNSSTYTSDFINWTTQTYSQFIVTDIEYGAGRFVAVDGTKVKLWY